MVRAVDIERDGDEPQGQVDMFAAIRASATPQVMLDVSRAIFAAPVTRRCVDDADADRRRRQGVAEARACGTRHRARRSRCGGEGRFQPASRAGTARHDRIRNAAPRAARQRLEFANGLTALVADNKVEPGKVRVGIRFGSGNRSVAGNAPIFCGPAIMR